MDIIPLEAEPNQQLLVILDDQECTLGVYSRGNRLFMDLTVDATPVFSGAICHNGADIVPFPTGLFRGSLHFYDREGHSDPSWEGLKDRYVLLYLAEDETLPDALAY